MLVSCAEIAMYNKPSHIPGYLWITISTNNRPALNNNKIIYFTSCAPFYILLFIRDWYTNKKIPYVTYAYVKSQYFKLLHICHNQLNSLDCLEISYIFLFIKMHGFSSL